MARGFLKGAVLGVVVSVGGAVGLSLLTGGPVLRSVTPETAQVDLPAGSGFNGARDDQTASLPESEPIDAPVTVPRVAAPEPDDLAPMAGTDTKSARPAAPGGVESGLGAPGETPAAAPEMAAKSDRSTRPGMQVEAPAAPVAETELSISTEPAQPQPPATETASFPEPAPVAETAPPEAPAVNVSPEVDETAPSDVAEARAEPSVEAEPESAPSPSVQTDAPTAPAVAQADPGADSAAVAMPAQAIETIAKPAGPDMPSAEVAVTVETETPAPPVEDTPDKDPLPERKPDKAAAADVPAIEPEPEAEADATPAPAAEAEPAPEIAVPAPAPRPMPKVNSAPKVLKLNEKTEAREDAAPVIRIGKPAGSLVGRKAAETGTRLPSVGAGTGTGQESGEASAMPPFKRYAVPFEGAENKPKMAIVLIDEGKGPVGIEALSTFPYPLTFAVDTAREDATDKMHAYRAAGFEVLAMVRLPEGAAPSDVEVAMPVLLAKVPEAVGVMEAPGDGIQFDRQVSDQVSRILGASGHGLLLYSKGLNTAQKLAAKNGVPSATIFRDVDGQGQKPSAIRRFLNYGALNAANEGGVVMVGRLRPDTVTALLLWGLEDRAGQVALAPVSQLLQVQH